VGDAHKVVKEKADWVTTSGGGSGAVIILDNAWAWDYKQRVAGSDMYAIKFHKVCIPVQVKSFYFRLPL